MSLKPKKSDAKVVCWKCKEAFPYGSKCPKCKDSTGTIELVGPDCTACKFARPNPFGNGDVFCKWDVENAGIGIYCDKFEKLNPHEK